MKVIKFLIISLLLTGISNISYCQQSEYYSKARDAYEEAASKSCPKRASVLREYAAWCQCMVDLLAGKTSTCGNQPDTPIPSCDESLDTTGLNESNNTPPKAYQIKSISILESFTSIKPGHFHSYRAKVDDGQYRKYIDTTYLEPSAFLSHRERNNLF